MPQNWINSSKTAKKSPCYATSLWITTLTSRLNVKQHNFSVQMYNKCRTFARFSLYHTLDQDICLLDSTSGRSKAQVVHTKFPNPTSCWTHHNVQISTLANLLCSKFVAFFNSTLHIISMQSAYLEKAIQFIKTAPVCSISERYTYGF